MPPPPLSLVRAHVYVLSPFHSRYLTVLRVQSELLSASIIIDWWEVYNPFNSSHILSSIVNCPHTLLSSLRYINTMVTMFGSRQNEAIFFAKKGRINKTFPGPSLRLSCLRCGVYAGNSIATSEDNTDAASQDWRLQKWQMPWRKSQGSSWQTSVCQTTKKGSPTTKKIFIRNIDVTANRMGSLSRIRDSR